MPPSKRLIKIFRGAATLTTKGISAPPLSYKQALEFFDELANRDDLALGHPQEACFARCHRMCEIALDKRYIPKKAWAIDRQGNRTLVFRMPNGKRISYWCHVAMVLSVKIPSGKVDDLVFCPALFDGPVSPEEWGRVINAPLHYPEITRLGIPPTGYYEDYNTRLRTTKVLSDPNHPRHPLQTIQFYQRQEIIPRIVFASQYCRDYIFPALGQWPERHGKGWTSTDPLPKPPPAHPAPPASPEASDTPKVGG